jgi:hypothetical protein
VTSSLRIIQDLVRDYLKTDEDFADIAVFNESSLDLNKDVEEALSEDLATGERKGLCVVIEMLSGKIANPEIKAIHFMPAMLHFMVIENVEINRNSGGNVRFGLDVAETLMAIMVNFNTAESGYEGLNVYPAGEGLDREDVPEMGVIIHHCFMRLNCGSEDNTPVVATPAITVDVNTRTATITCATEFAEIRYTIDGSRPTRTSTLYSGAIDVSAVSNINARGYRPGFRGSLIANSIIGLGIATEADQAEMTEDGKVITEE